MCLLFLAKHDEDVESNMLYSYNQIISQSFSEDGKCGRLCLTLGGDAHFWCALVTPVNSDGFIYNDLLWTICETW